MNVLPAYFLTWTTYGTWLHGDLRGSVDDEHNTPGTPYLPPRPTLQKSRQAALSSAPVVLSTCMRSRVDEAIRMTCYRRTWTMHALNVRSNHVHIVLSAHGYRPETVMSQLKSWATRSLRMSELPDDSSRVWTKMGSTRWLNDHRSLDAAIEYVLHRQGSI